MVFIQVSEFPIFLHFGDVNVHIKVNVDIICLDPEHYEKLEKFHNKLFLDLLGVKDFVIRDYNNENNSYLIIPIYYSGLVFVCFCMYNIYFIFELF